MDALLSILPRLLHFTGLFLLVGPMFYARLMAATPPAFARPLVLLGSALTLIGGFWNFFMRIGAGVPKGYHMVFGIKFLLALHIIAMAFLMTNAAAPAEKRTRWMTGALITVVLNVILASYLRFLTQ
jgi:hypothetical protein